MRQTISHTMYISIGLFLIAAQLAHADWVLMQGTSSTYWYIGLTADGHGKVFLYESTGGGGDGFWEYDILSDNWQQIVNTPIVGRGAYLEADTSSSLIYWQSGYQRFFVYDQNGGFWTELSQTPIPAWSDGYVMTNSDMCLDHTSGKLYWHSGDRGFYEYDLSLDTWTQKDSTPVSGNGDMVVHPGLGKIYWHQGFDPNSGHQNGFYEYDIAGDSWQTRAFTPVTCANGGLTIIPSQNKLYWSRGGLSADFMEYDIQTDAWTLLGTTPMNGQFGNLAADWSTNKIYYYGGFSVDPDSIFWEYTPGIGVFEQRTSVIKDIVPYIHYKTPIRGNEIMLHIRLSSQEIVKISVIDASGVIVLRDICELSHGNSNVNIGLRNFNQGVYFIVLQIAGETIVKKFVLLK